MAEESSRFQEMLKKYLVPVANKIENQVHIQAMKDGMISIVPIIIVGSFCLLSIAIMNLLPEGIFLHTFLADHIDNFMLPFNFTMGILSLFSAFFIAESLARRYGMNGTEIGMTSLVVQLIVCAIAQDGKIETTYLDAQGLFVSIFIALLVVEITRFMNSKSLVIKLPKEVPSIVSKSFNNLLPMIVNIIIFTSLTVLVKSISGSSIPQVIMEGLAPALNSIDNVYVVVLIIFVTQLLWFFGLHGASITSSIWMPIASTYIAVNAANITNGQDPTHIFTFGFYNSILQVTGSGVTLGLVILMMRSKSKTLRPIGKVSFIPSLFGINEPVIFGAPLMMNPYMFIPFVFGPTILAGINYTIFASGWIGKPMIEPPGFMPPGVGAFIMTLDWKVFIIVFATIIVMGLFYYPFFKTMEKEQLKKEQETEESFDDSNFDF